jgi:DDE_Tnp_1-associated
MSPKPGQPITKHFASLQDPRVERTKLHKLQDILVIAICAILCGADDWVAVEAWGNAKREWLEKFLELPNGIPSHDTFGRVFARIDPQQFQQCFLSWIRAVAKQVHRQVVAIDGKKLRRSHDRTLGKSAIAMVSAWATANRLVLGQRKVKDKSNEITAIPELLRVLELMPSAARPRLPKPLCNTTPITCLPSKKTKDNSIKMCKTCLQVVARLIFGTCRMITTKPSTKDTDGSKSANIGRFLIPSSWIISASAGLGRICKPSSWRAPNGASAPQRVWKRATTSPVWRTTRSWLFAPHADTGASRIALGAGHRIPRRRESRSQRPWPRELGGLTPHRAEFAETRTDD